MTGWNPPGRKCCNRKRRPSIAFHSAFGFIRSFWARAFPGQAVGHPKEKQDRPQANRPRKLDDRGEAHLIALACSSPGASRRSAPPGREGTRNLFLACEPLAGWRAAHDARLRGRSSLMTGWNPPGRKCCNRKRRPSIAFHSAFGFIRSFWARAFPGQATWVIQKRNSPAGWAGCRSALSASSGQAGRGVGETDGRRYSSRLITILSGPRERTASAGSS